MFNYCLKPSICYNIVYHILIFQKGSCLIFKITKFYKILSIKIKLINGQFIKIFIFIKT